MRMVISKSKKWYYTLINNLPDGLNINTKILYIQNWLYYKICGFTRLTGKFGNFFTFAPLKIWKTMVLYRKYQFKGANWNEHI